VEIVKYQPHFAVAVADVFHAAVHAIDPKIYTDPQQEAWAPTPPDYGFWKTRLEIKQPLIALNENRVIGFIELDHDGHINCTYVHPDFQGQSVARRLYSALESKARTQKLHRLTVEASIVAKPFFESLGFTFVKENQVHHKGEIFTNFTLEKLIATTHFKNKRQ